LPLTRDFKDTVQARAERDPEFRIGLLQEAVEAFIHGETEEGKILLRDYVNATVGFGPLADALGNTQPKSLMRMLSSSGNPRMENLFAMIAYLQQREGVSLDVVPKQTRKPKRTLEKA
jgi:DNA-binding phage protein